MLLILPSPGSRVRRVSMRSSGQPLRSAYSRTVRIVQAPRAASNRFRRRGTGVLAALVHGLVHEQAVRPHARFRLQIAEPGDFHRSCHVLSLC